MKTQSVMKSLIVPLLLLASTVLAAEDTPAERQLPEPGTWVKYQLTMERDGKRVRQPVELTYKFLERTKQDREDFGRIELVMTIHQQGQEAPIEDCIQLSIREAALRKGEVTAEDFKEFLHRRGDGNIENWTDRLEGEQLSQAVVSVWLLSGVAASHRDAQEHTGEEKTIDCRRGEFSSGRWVIVPMFEKQTDPLKRERMLMKVLLHEKVPNRVLFAVLEEQESTRPSPDAEWSEDRPENIYRHTLIDFGTGAKATLKE